MQITPVNFFLYLLSACDLLSLFSGREGNLITRFIIKFISKPSESGCTVGVPRGGKLSAARHDTTTAV